MRVRRTGFSLVELLVALAVLGILSALVVTGMGRVGYQARESQSTSNIRQLAQANLLYAADRGHYAPNGNVSDTIHWHGRREGGKFTGRDGYLSPYLDDGGARLCPVLEDLLRNNSDLEGSQFDEGTGGYGYNAMYIGGFPPALDQRAPAGAKRGSVLPWWAQGNRPANIESPAEVVMFASSALVRGGGLVETGSVVPYREIVSGGFGRVLTPTTHFRFQGRALVAWADAHVTLEPPNENISTEWNVYDGDNGGFLTGWFGDADEWNGAWNPRSGEQRPY